MNQVAQVKDLSSLIVALENKADSSDVAELLKGKANKQSVANALHRKANKEDMDEALTKKVDVTDFEQVVDEVSRKADVEQLEEIMNTIAGLPTGAEFDEVMATKADQKDVDAYIKALSTQRRDFEERLMGLEKDTTSVLQDIRYEMKQMQESIKRSLDQSVSERDLAEINEALNSKISIDNVQKMIEEVSSGIEKRRISLEKEMFSRLATVEKNSTSCSTEFETLNSRLQAATETMRIEVDERIRTQRKSYDEEIERMGSSIDELMKELDYIKAAKVEKREMDVWVESLKRDLEPKVDLHEVQSALNACQTDIQNRVHDLREEVLSQFKDLDESRGGRENEVERLEQFLSEKVDQSVLNEQLQDKASQ